MASDLGALLTRAGVITQAQLRQALDAAEKSGDSLIPTLARLGVASELEVAKAAARKLAMPFLALDGYVFERAVVGRLPETLCRRLCAVPVAEKAGVLQVAVADPALPGLTGELALAAKMPIKVFVACYSEVVRVLDLARAPEGKSGREVERPSRPPSPAPASPASKLPGDAGGAVVTPGPVDPPGAAAGVALRAAVARGVTEILMEPRAAGIRVRWRLDGRLQDAPESEASALWAAREGLAYLARIPARDTRLPQIGYFELSTDGRPVRFWFQSLPGAAGPAYALTVHHLQPYQPPTLDTLGLDEAAAGRLREALSERDGMILVTGPTRSGKTVTLYAALRSLGSPSKVILTAEDPVQERVEGAIQVECHPDQGLDFAAALYSFKVRRPEVILLQELRDTSTTNAAVQAALRDTLVLTSLHTSDSTSTLGRLLDMGLEPYLAAQAVRLVQAQRLLRRVCASCAAPGPLDAQTRQALGLTEELLARLGLPAELLSRPETRRGRGCAQCNHTGHRGQVLIAESFAMSGEIRHLVLRSASSSELRRQARAEGLRTLREAALREVLLGTTTPEEALLSTPAER